MEREGRSFWVLKKRQHSQRSRRQPQTTLEVEVIDLYQIHWPDPDPDIEEAWSTMADLVKEGKSVTLGFLILT